MSKFTVGDKVTWTSQAGGVAKTKTGVVVAVLPDMAEPTEYLPLGTVIDGPGWPRRHESYFVQIGRRKHLFWPRVCHLSLATEAD